MIGIYKITSPSGKIYIGQSWDIDSRFKSYRTLSNRCKEQPAIYNSLIKYSPEHHIFEVEELLNYATQESLDKAEIFYINRYRNLGFNMLNIKEGGSSGKHCKETIRKCSVIKRRHWIDGVYSSEEYRIKQSKAHKNKPNPNKRKAIRCNETGEIFNSIEQAAAKFAGNPKRSGNIVSHLKGRLRIAYKHTFSYID